jgi:AcrR family transcriptional regulator
MPCGPPGLRERKKAQTRTAIVEAALDLFERQGFEATTVEDIAAAADVSPRTFFRYFESKQDVVMAKSHEQGDGLGTLLVARPPHEGPVEALRQAILSELGGLVSGADDTVLREMRVMMSTPDLRAMALDHFHEHQEDLAAALAVRMGQPPDALAPHVLAGVFGTAVWAVVDRWVAEGAQADRLMPMIDEVFTMLASGFDALAAGTASSGADVVTD